ncbi:ADH1 [Candida theae]|uniref:alcohol dehydrogenase n=1 Tax=Candida theae TaxID=1198502 RepID=A0AAD5G0I6_9ASCO|nr:ADH1 [Candida theae]KAI5965463.1 ADH1 [Candida theae]
MAVEIPKTQKAVVYETNGGPLIYKDIPVPQIKPTEILVNIKYSGVCHSDLSAYKGAWPVPYKLPLVGGHEGAGVVVAVGDNVEGWKVGDLAGVKLINSTCLNCDHCQQGNETICAKTSLNGITADGTFQQYCATDAIQAAKLPSDIDLKSVGPILCAGITVYKGLKSSEAKPGQWVAISGAAGGLGSLAIQYARALGLRVVGIDGGGEKGKFVKSLGAEAYVDFTKSKDIAKDIVAITGGGAHAALNVSSSEQAIQKSVEYVRPNGTVILIGLPANAKVSLDILTTVVKQVTVRGSYVGTKWDTTEAVDFFHRGLVKCPIKVVSLKELERVFKEMEDGKILGRYVLELEN